MSYGTRNFTESEIGSVPAPWQANALATAQLLELYRAALGNVPFPLTGPFYRSPAANAAAGGAPTSQHLVADAGDFVVSGVSVEEGARRIIAARHAGTAPEFGQLVVHLVGPTHIHLGRPTRVSGRVDEILVETAVGVFRSWDGISDPRLGPVQSAPEVDRDNGIPLAASIVAGAIALGVLHG